MIHIESSFKTLPVPAESIERAASAALKHRSAAGDLSVILTGDARLQQLNRDYLGIDAPTDVLSFPASEMDPETSALYLGDVLISISRARRQARMAGHPLEAELQLLVVHGVLHLLGYDHAEPEDKKKMWAVQGQALESLGLAGIVINES